MAKKSMLEREKKRELAVQKYAAKRQALKEAGDWEALSKLPRNASPTRLHNRCKLTAVPTALCVNSEFAATSSVIWLTAEKFRALRKPAGKFREED